MKTHPIIRRASRNVDVREFNTASEPIPFKKLDLKCPYERQYILRMVVRADGGEFLIPDELSWLQEAFLMALQHQKDVIKVEKSFCYITVRHGVVTSQTDDSWHVDGFSVKTPHVPEQNYIWSNIDSTEYVETKEEFPSDFDPRAHNVNTFLESRIGSRKVQKCESGVLYCLDPYILHRRPHSTTGQQRTFFRISFVPIEIDDINNTQNPLLPRKYKHDGVNFRNQLTNYNS